MAFIKATRKRSRLRIGLIGPSGAGKTWTALAIASGLGKRIAVLDTERGSASLYSGDFSFDVCELQSFAPARYVAAIEDADREGYDVIVVDSLSHAWMGAGGALEMVDAAQKRSKAGNSFAAWREVTPEHNRLVDAILQAKAHVIITMRSKTEYVLEEDGRGRKVPRKVGLAPIQRDGLEYEFTVVGELDLEHNLCITKTRCQELDSAVIARPDAKLGRRLAAWLDGAAPGASEPPPPAPVFAAPAKPPAVREPAQAEPEREPGADEEPEARPLVDNLREAISTAATMPDLISAWQSANEARRRGLITAWDLTALQAVKDARKAHLAKPAAPPAEPPAAARGPQAGHYIAPGAVDESDLPHTA